MTKDNQTNMPSYDIMSTTAFYQKHPKETHTKQFCRLFDLDHNGSVFVYYGDVQINTDLLLNYAPLIYYFNLFAVPHNNEAHLLNKPDAIVIYGNLTIDGLLDNNDAGSTLYVKGNVSAKNVIAGNSAIFIDGHLAVKEILIGFYNDGELQVDKGASCALFFQNDHCFDISSPFEVTYPSLKAAQKANALNEQARYIKDDNESEIIRLLSQGISLFSHEDQYIEDYHYWLNQVTLSRSQFKRVPNEFKDENLYLTAIGHFPQNYQNLSKKEQTSELIYQLLSQYSCSEIIRYIPETLYTQGIVDIICEKYTASDVLKYIPAKFMSKTLARKVAKTVSSFGYIPRYLTDEEIAYLFIRSGKKMFDQWRINNIPRQYYSVRTLAECAKKGFLPYHRRMYEYYHDDLRISFDDIAFEAIKEGIEVIDKLPGYLVSEKVYQHLEQNYSQGECAEQWLAIKKRHQHDFYQYIYDKEQLERFPQAKYANAYCGEFSLTNMAFTYYLWRAFWSKEYCHEALIACYRGDESLKLISFIPPEFLTPELGFHILKSGQIFHHHDALQLLPKTALNYRNCCYYVQRLGNMDSVPTEYITEDLCLLLVKPESETEFGMMKGRAKNLDKIPPEFRTEKVIEYCL